MPKSNGSTPWTPAESATLAEMRHRGARDAEIGEALGRSSSSIASRGSTLRRSGEADVLAVRHWSDDEVEQVIDLWDSGETNASIGAAIGRSEWAVRERIRWLQAEGTLAGGSRGVDRDHVRRIPANDPLLAALHAEHARRGA